MTVFTCPSRMADRCGQSAPTEGDRPEEHGYPCGVHVRTHWQHSLAIRLSRTPPRRPRRGVWSQPRFSLPGRHRGTWRSRRNVPIRYRVWRVLARLNSGKSPAGTGKTSRFFIMGQPLGCRLSWPCRASRCPRACGRCGGWSCCRSKVCCVRRARRSSLAQDPQCAARPAGGSAGV